MGLILHLNRFNRAAYLEGILSKCMTASSFLFLALMLLLRGCRSLLRLVKGAGFLNVIYSSLSYFSSIVISLFDGGSYAISFCSYSMTSGGFSVLVIFKMIFSVGFSLLVSFF